MLQYIYYAQLEVCNNNNIINIGTKIKIKIYSIKTISDLTISFKNIKLALIINIKIYFILICTSSTLVKRVITII
jgi:hypothetical protein